MQEIVANVDHIYFNIEKALDLQLGSQTLPFLGMDKSGSAICSFFLTSTCSKGMSCPFRHVKGDRSVVCKHWLRGLCKKGDNCEFLHEYDMQKMPECYFYSRFGECGNKDCPFLHIDPEQKIKVCPWYDRGFCRHGALCKNRHVRKVMCVNYMCGFCLDGPSCKYIHPRFELPIFDSITGSQITLSKKITCHFCNEVGHKAISCPHLLPSLKPLTSQTNGALQQYSENQKNSNQLTNQIQMATSIGYRHDLRPLDQVTCFKCGEKGHYANKCPKGHLAFLTGQAILLKQQHANMLGITNTNSENYNPPSNVLNQQQIFNQNNSTFPPSNQQQIYNQQSVTSFQQTINQQNTNFNTSINNNIDNVNNNVNTISNGNANFSVIVDSGKQKESSMSETNQIGFQRNQPNIDGSIFGKVVSNSINNNVCNNEQSNNQLNSNNSFSSINSTQFIEKI